MRADCEFSPPQVPGLKNNDVMLKYQLFFFFFLVIDVWPPLLLRACFTDILLSCTNLVNCFKYDVVMRFYTWKYCKTMHYGCRVVGKLMLQINDEIDKKNWQLSKAQSSKQLLSTVNNTYIITDINVNVYINVDINVKVGFVTVFDQSHRLKLNYNCL